MKLPSCKRFDSPYFNHVNDTNDHINVMDTALVRMDSAPSAITVCVQSAQCDQCEHIHLLDIEAGQNATMSIDTRYPVSFSFRNKHNLNEELCSFQSHLQEHAWYTVHLQDNGTHQRNCDLRLSRSFPDSNIPLYVALSIMIGVSFLWFLSIFLHKKYFTRKQNQMLITDDDFISQEAAGPSDIQSSEIPLATSIVAPVQRNRICSLDTFRGVCLVIMIFVNYRGGGYWFFSHSAWNGLTVADLVFPWFVFIMGTSIALAFQKQLRKGISRKHMAISVMKRTVILFALGFIQGNKPKYSSITSDPGLYVDDLRFLGVLQQLAVTYMVVALLETYFAKGENSQQCRWPAFRDIIPFWAEWMIILGLVGVHLLLTFLLPIPGCPKGYLGPGGLHDDSNYTNCTGGAARVIDAAIFGNSHLYQRPTCKALYMSQQPFDPDGILGHFTSIFLCFLGLQAGRIMVTYPEWKSKLVRWCAWAICMGLVGGLLCGFSQNDGIIPVNKNLWSFSFVLALGSLAFVLLAFFFVVNDVLMIWNGSPFSYTGMNSILIYLCHEFFIDYFPIYFHVKNTHAAQLALSLWGTAFWVIVSAVLYYKKIFLSV